MKRSWPGRRIELWWFWDEWSLGVAHGRTRRGIGGPVLAHHVFLSAGPLTVRVVQRDTSGGLDG